MSRVKYSDELLLETLTEIKHAVVESKQQIKIGDTDVLIQDILDDILYDLGDAILPDHTEPTGSYDKRVYESIIKKDFDALKRELFLFTKRIK